MPNHVTFPQETEEQLESLSREHGVPVNAIIRSLIYNGLAQDSLELNPALPTEIRSLRRINPKPGGDTGPTITFVNDNSSGASPDQPVHPKLASMVEHVISVTGINININSSVRSAGGTSNHGRARAIDINRVNGNRVDSFPANGTTRDLVTKLQQEFQKHANIRENFGPFLCLKTESSGATPIDRPDQKPGHQNHIHIACQA